MQTDWEIRILKIEIDSETELIMEADTHSYPAGHLDEDLKTVGSNIAKQTCECRWRGVMSVHTILWKRLKSL